MTDTFLTDVEREGTGLSEEEKETPPESSTENNQEDKADSSPESEETDDSKDKKDAKPEVFQAFHKHPKWIALHEELKELREFRDKVNPLLEQIGKTDKETAKIPKWFITVFGENQEAWDQYREYDIAQRQELRKEVLNELKEQSQKAAEADKRINEQIEKSIQEIVSDEELGARAKAMGFDFKNKEQLQNFRNELLKVAVDKEITNLNTAFEFLELKKSSRAMPGDDKRKELADKTIQKGKAEGDKKSYLTSHDLQGKTFRDLID